MNQVLIVKNIPREGPGLLVGVLDEAKVTYDLIDLENGETFPNPIGYKAMVVLGGPDSANDTTPKMLAELKQIKVALDNNIPVLGICLGLQTLVKASGGSVVKAENKEVGFIDPAGEQYLIETTDEGRKSSLLAGLGEHLNVFHLHGETVILTQVMKLLGSGKYCKNQIVQVNEVSYGIQSHFELTPEILTIWAEQDPDLIPIGREKLFASFNAIKEGYAKTGKILFTNFLKITKLI